MQNLVSLDLPTPYSIGCESADYGYQFADSKLLDSFLLSDGSDKVHYSDEMS